MHELENGYFYGDSNGNVRFVSYDSLGGGGFFFALIILGTIFLKKFGNFLIDNQWVVIIPTIIAVVVRFIIYDIKSSATQKICNIISDVIRTLGFYGVLISLFSKVLSCHVLDRIFVAFGLGLLFTAAYVLINMLCKFFRRKQLFVSHLIISIAIYLISLIIYFNQVANGNIKLSNQSTTSTNTQADSLDILIDSIDSITFSTKNFPGLSLLISLISFVFASLLIALIIFIGIKIGKRINSKNQTKFDCIGNELKKFLPNDADVYYVRHDGISYLDKQEKNHFLSYQQLGYEDFPIENESVTMHYINNMGQWLLKNIVFDAKRYKVDISSEGLGYLCLRTDEYIRKHTLKNGEI